MEAEDGLIDGEKKTCKRLCPQSDVCGMPSPITPGCSEAQHQQEGGTPQKPSLEPHPSPKKESAFSVCNLHFNTKPGDAQAWQV